MNLVKRAPLLIAAAVIMPLIMFLAIETSFSSRDQRRLVESQALARVEKVMVESDAIVSRSLGALDALTTVTAFGAGNFGQVYTRSREIAALNPDWVTVVLTDLGSGREIFDLRRPFGAARPAAFAREALPPGLSARAIVDGIGGSGPGCPCVVIHRLVPDRGHGILLLSVEVDQRQFQRLLKPVAGESRPIGIVDQHHKFVARSIRPKETIGHTPSRSLTAMLDTGRKSGIYSSRTLEDVVSYTAFASSQLSGWSAHVAFDPNLLDGPQRRSVLASTLAALAALLLAAGLIAFTLRQLRESRRVERRFEEAQKMEALGQLTGGIAHDFNNLLTPILGGLDLLSREPSLEGRRRRIVESALVSARKAGKLATQLLAFSRRQNLEVGPVDLPGLLSEIDPILRQSAGSAIDILIDVDSRAGCVLSDPNQLELALLNLVVNARDAMPGGGTITISAVRSAGDDSGPGDVELSIADSGEGMSPEVMRRATEPFFTTKPPGSGTGLGLAQVYGATRQAGGSLHLDSQPGKGTTVTLRLRGCDRPPVKAAPVRVEVDRMARADQRILVCDDDDAARAFVAQSLEAAGYVVEHVSNGATAVEALRHAHFDLIVCDFAMRGMNGAEVARHARTLDRPVGFLLITGYADSEALTGIGVEIPVLRKPFDDAALTDAVREALQREVTEQA